MCARIRVSRLLPERGGIIPRVAHSSICRSNHSPLKHDSLFHLRLCNEASPPYKGQTSDTASGSSLAYLLSYLSHVRCCFCLRLAAVCCTPSLQSRTRLPLTAEERLGRSQSRSKRNGSPRRLGSVCPARMYVDPSGIAVLRSHLKVTSLAISLATNGDESRKRSSERMVQWSDESFCDFAIHVYEEDRNRQRARGNPAYSEACET